MNDTVCPFCVIGEECAVCRSRPWCFFSEPEDRVTLPLFDDEPDAAEYENYRQSMTANL